MPAMISIWIIWPSLPVSPICSKFLSAMPLPSTLWRWVCQKLCKPTKRCSAKPWIRLKSYTLTLSCIGAGRAGKTLCRLFAEQQSELRYPFSRLSIALGFSTEAVSFIGQGEPARGLKICAGRYLAELQRRMMRLQRSVNVSQSGCSAQGDISFSLQWFSKFRDLLTYLRQTFYRASVHPIHSFANPQNSLTDFSGSACAVEGDPCARLF